jgi:uncharacterized protein (TIGR02145 family)
MKILTILWDKSTGCLLHPGIKTIPGLFLAGKPHGQNHLPVACFFSVLLLGCFLLFQPFQVIHAQVKTSYDLGPQLLPMADPSPELIYHPNPRLLVSNCDNSDFSYGNWTNWTGCYGVYNNPCQVAGLDTVRPNRVHVMVSGPGYLDWNTCDSLITVFPGESFGARLGDTIYSAARQKAAELRYGITVTDQSYLFVYRYAVVLQTGGHNPPDHQPDFQVMITDNTGKVLDSTCGYYYITAQVAGAPVNGWHRCTWAATGAVYWKDWTTVGMDLSSYFGQTIFVIFKVRPCSYNTHFGYAYINAYCSYLQVHNAMCEDDTSATLEAPPGFTYLWNTGDTTASITVPHPTTGSAYSCTLTAINGCQVTIYDTLTYTINHANFTYGVGCAGLPMQFNDSSWVSQNAVTGWEWNFGDASPIVTGDPDPTHIYSSSGDFNVTLVSNSTEGCTDTITKTIHVDSLPVITNTVLRQRICNGGITGIAPTSTVTNTLYTWTTTASSLNLSGYSDNPTIPSSFTNQTLTNSGTKLDSVVYHFTPHRLLCAGPVKDFTVEVGPVPLLSNPVLSKTICDSVSTNILLTSTTDSARFTWTCTANPGNNLNGYSDNNTLPGLLNINQVIDNTGDNVDTLFYHITGHAYGCDGPTYIYKVIVNPKPLLANLPLSKTICSKDFTNVMLASNVTGTLFTWTCTPSGPGITGWSDNLVPGTFLNQQLFNSTPANGTVTYAITPHANGCNGSLYQYVVTVKPIPSMINIFNPSICSGVTTNIILQSNMAGSTFSWTAAGSSGNVSGYSNSSGPVISQTLVNSGLTTESVTYTVTPANNGCIGTGSGIVVTVFPVADAYFTPASQTLCSAEKTNLVLASHVGGSTFIWNASGSSGNVNGFSPGAGNTIAQTLNNTGFSVETVTYNAQATANGCPGTWHPATVTVNPVPVVSYLSCNDNTTTTTGRLMKLAGGIPPGGTYSGAGVIAGSFNPSTAGLGTHTITYEYFNYLGCSRKATRTITVVNPPAFFCGNNLTDVRDNKQYPTVKLGTRCWMASNLNYGSVVPSSVMQMDNCTNEKYCFNDNLANCSSSGGLYQWDELMHYTNFPAEQGFCPPGWHVPTENEWNALFALYISNGFAGSPLKFDGYSGFNAFLSGVRHTSVAWDFSGFAILFWSSTEHTSDKAWAHGMNTFNPSVSYYPASKVHAFAVRCIQD